MIREKSHISFSQSSSEFRLICLVIFILFLLYFVVLPENVFSQDNIAVQPVNITPDSEKATLTPEEIEWLTNHKTIRVAADPVWQPVEYRDEAGKYQGISIEYLNIIEKKLNIKFEFVQESDWGTMIEMSKNKQLDLFSAVSKTPEREKYLLFSDPYISFPICVFTLDDVPYINDLNNLNNKKVAIIKGYALEDWIKAKYPEIILEKTKNVKMGLEALRKHEVEAYIDNLVTTGYYIKTCRYTNIKVAGETPFRNDLSFAIRNDWPTLASIINKTLLGIPESKKNEIYNKWISIKYEYKINLSTIWKISIIALIIILIIFYWNRKLTNEIKSRKETEKTLHTALSITQSIQHFSSLSGLYEEIIKQIVNSANVELGILYEINEMAQTAAIKAIYNISKPDDSDEYVPDLEFLLEKEEELLFCVNSRREILPDKDKIKGRHSIFIPVVISNKVPAVFLLKRDKMPFSSYEIEKINFLAINSWTAVERKKAEEMILSNQEHLENMVTKRTLELLDNEERLRTLINAVPDLVCFKDSEGKWLEANEYTIKLFQLEGFYYRGKKDSELGEINQFHKNTFRICEETDEYAWKGKVPSRGDEIVPLPDGSEKAFDIIKIPMFHGDGSRKGIVVIGRDITKRKKIESELRTSEERFRAVIENMPVLLYAFNDEDCIIFWNKECEKITGYAREEIIGSNNLMEVLYPDENYRQFVNDTINIHNGYYLDLEFEVICKDGTKKTISWTNISNNIPIKGWYGWTIGRDVTENIRIMNSQHNLEAQLRQSQKLEAVGQLAGGVAHDFNNILQVIRGYIDLLHEEIGESGEIRDNVDEISLAVERATTLVRQLLTFSRKEGLQLKTADINEIVSGLMKMIRRIIGEHIELIFSPGLNLPIIIADCGQLEQIILNLCVNARDAMPNGGKLIVETGKADIDEEYCSSNLEAKPGDYIFLSISDTGQGIPYDIIDRVFEPFFSTKRVGEGTGLGLATVYAITRKHEGFIDLHSELNLGTTIKVYLPASSKPENTLDESSQSGSKMILGTGETILFAEDDNQVRQLGINILTKGGYNVISAENGEIAIKEYDKHYKTIDAAVLDVVMPKKSGKAVYDHIMSKNPGLPILFASGYSFNILEAHSLPKDKCSIIQKPYNQKMLLTELKKSLEKRRSIIK